MSLISEFGKDGLNITKRGEQVGNSVCIGCIKVGARVGTGTRHKYEGYEELYLVKGCWKVGDMVIVEGSRKNWTKVLSWPHT